VKDRINKNIYAVSNFVNAWKVTRIVSHDVTICPLICVAYRHSRQATLYDASPPDNSMYSVETMLRVGYGLHVCRWVEIRDWSEAAQVICLCFVRIAVSVSMVEGALLVAVCGVTGQKTIIHRRENLEVLPVKEFLPFLVFPCIFPGCLTNFISAALILDFSFLKIHV
jgi:hypothetical protein